MPISTCRKFDQPIVSWLARSACLSAAVLLAGCMSSADAPGFDPLPPRAITPGVQQVSLPLTGPSVVRFQVVDMPDRDLPQVPLSGAGVVNLSVASDLEDRLLRVVITPVDERIAHYQDDIDTTQSTMPEQAVLVVTGRQVNRGGLGFNPLSDYIARRLDDYLLTTTDARLAYLQDGLAAEFIAYDLDGDGKVDYNDVMAFDPQNAEHLRRLKFDYEARVGLVLSSGRTLLQTYATQPEALDVDLFDALSPMESYDMPAIDTVSVTLLHADTNKGGAVTIDALPSVRLDADNGRLLLRDPISDAPRRYTLQAHAEEGWRFVRWVGCDSTDGAGACMVRMDDNKDVSAQFALLENILAPGVASVLRLDDYATDAYGFVLSDDGNLSVNDVTDPALRQALSALQQDSVIATGRWREPMLRIMQAPQPPQAGANGSSYRFAVQSVSYLDTYQALSTFTGDAPVSILEISSAKVELYADEDSQVAQTASARTVQNATAQGDGGLVWLVGHGYAVDAGSGYYVMQNPDGAGFQLARATGAVQDVPREQVLGVLDATCAARPDAPECGLSSRGKRAMAGETSGCLILVGGCNIKVIEVSWTRKEWGDSATGNAGKLGGTLSIEGNIDVSIAHSSMHFMWSAVPPAMDFAMNARGVASAAVGATLFLGLEGKFTANKNIVMKGKEAYLQAQEAAQQESLTRERREALEQHFAVDDPKFNNPKVGNPVQVAGLEAAASAAQVAVGPPGAPAAPGAQDQGRARSGAVDFTGSGRPRSKAFAFRFEPNPQAKPTGQKAAGISLVLNRGTPDGAVMPLTFKLDLGVRGKGKLGVELKAGLEQRVPFDIDIDIGSSCERDRVWFVIVTNCKSGKKQRMEMHARPKTYTTASLQAVANAEIEPYVEVSLNYGPALLKEDLIKITAGPSLMFNMVGNAGWTYSNHPDQKALYAGVPEGCFRAKASFALTGDFVLQTAGVVDASIEKEILGKTFKISLFEMEIFKLQHKIPLFEPVVYQGGIGGVDDADACLPANQRPARYFQEELSWRPGELKWDEPNFVMTHTRKLELRDDGAFVLRRLVRADNGAGAVKSEDILPWPNGKSTSTYPGARVAFQEDGNLVVYSVGEVPIWSSGTYRGAAAAANMRLVLQRDGNMVIYEGQNAIWASNTYGR